MGLSKAELILQIANSSGLKGKALEEFKDKLQSKSLDELSSMISNAKIQATGFKAPWEDGFKQALDDGMFGFKSSIKPRKEPVYTESQKLAMEFLTGNLSAAKQNMADREKEAGPLSSVVNTWKEVFDQEIAKSTVKKQIASTDADVSQLEKTARGEIVRDNFASGKQETVSFEETFQKQRGVKFSQQNVEDCQEKSEIFARVKTSKQMVDNLKSQLSHYTAGTVSAAMDKTGASKTIYDIFKMSGVDHSTYMNQALKQISEKYKDHPDVKKYGGEFQFAQENGKIKNPPTLLRRAGNGELHPVTTEGLRVIAKELTQNLNTAYATALGAEIPQGSTNEQIEKIAQGKYDQYQKEYETSFATAYGKKDLKALSERYIAAQQKGIENIEMGINIASMALMVVPGGAVATANLGLRGALVAKNSATLTNMAKGLSLVDKARAGVVGAQKLALVSQKLSPVIMGNMIARPVYLADQLMSENGMSADEWEQWGVGVLQSSAYMALGMGASKLAEQGAAMYKTRALVGALKESGKSADEIAAMIKANPVKFPKDIVQSFGKINTTAKALQIPIEVALDLGSTYAMNKAMNNGELQTQDWVNSLMFAINGGVLQKQFKPLSKDAKADFLVNAFKDYSMTKDEAFNVLKTMDDISSGKIRVKKTKSTDVNQNTGGKPTELPEVVVTAPAVKAEAPKAKAETPVFTGEVGKAEAPKTEATNAEAPKTEATKIEVEVPKAQEANPFVKSTEAPTVKVEPNKVEAPKIEVKPLTPEEFQAKKAELMHKVKEFELLKNIGENSLNEHNIFVLEAIVKNPEIINNKNFTDKFIFAWILINTNSVESAKARIDVIDAIEKRPKLLTDPRFKNFAGKVDNILQIIDSKAKADLLLKHIDNLDKAYPNLTHLLSNELHSRESLNLKLLTHLTTDRNVGGIPDGWLNNTPKSQQKKVVTKLYDRLADFGKIEYVTDEQIKSLSDDLGTLLNSAVNIKFVGDGMVGNGYKVTIGEKDFFLKTFKGNGTIEHGSGVEVQAGLYANKHARENQFAKFFFGRVTGSIYEDGFMVNEFVEVNTKKATPAKKNNPIIDSRPLYQDFVTSGDKGASTNGSTGHNTLNGKIIDFGAFFKENPHLDNAKMRQTFRVFAERIYENKFKDGSTDYVMSDANAKILLNYAKKNLSKKEFEQAVQVYSQKLPQNSDAWTKLLQIQDEIYKLR